MRISDWSSDVCSSDLDLENERLFEHQRAVYSGLALTTTRPARSTPNRATGYCSRLGKIGRASCRERVCQYGVDLGGRGLIKKTTMSKQRWCGGQIKYEQLYNDIAKLIK